MAIFVVIFFSSVIYVSSILETLSSWMYASLIFFYYHHRGCVERKKTELSMAVWYDCLPTFRALAQQVDAQYATVDIVVRQFPMGGVSMALLVAASFHASVRVVR
jgi:hypothetical protein